jgi:hypothetical protein
VGPHVRLEGADVLPIALGDAPEDRLARPEQRREHLAREVHRPVRRDVVEDLGLQHEDAGVDGVAEDLAPGRLLEEPLDGAVGSGDDDAELERVVDRHQADGGQGRPLLVEGDDLAEVDVGEDVAGDDEEALVEHVHRVADRPGRPEGLLLGRVDHLHAELAAVAEVVAYDVRHERQGHDDLVDAVVSQQVDDVLHHRAVHQRQHRLGLVAGERPEAAPLTAGHDHRFHRG